MIEYAGAEGCSEKMRECAGADRCSEKDGVRTTWCSVGEAQLFFLYMVREAALMVI